LASQAQAAGQTSVKGKPRSQIFQDLLLLRDLEEARVMVKAQSQSFSAANTATALKRVAQLSMDLPWSDRRRLASDPILEELLGLVSRNLPGMRAAQMADVVWACGRMAYHPGAILGDIAAKCEREVESMTASDITKLMWGGAKLGNLPGDLLPLMCTQLAQTDLSQITAHGLSNIGWSLATLQHTDTALLEDLANTAAMKAEEFGPQGLANIAWSFGTLKHYSPGLMDSLAAAAHLKLRNFTTQGLMNFLWAFGVLRHTPSELLPDALTEAARRLPEGRPVDVSSLAVTCARLRTAPAYTMNAVMHRALEIAREFRPSELSGLLWALAALKCKMPEGLWEKLQAAVMQVHTKFGPAELASTLWALSRMTGHRMPNDCLSRLLDSAEELLPRMDAGTASSTIQAASRLSGAYAASGAMARVTAAIRELRIDYGAYSVKERTQLLWAIAKLEKKVERWYLGPDGVWKKGRRSVRQLPSNLVGGVLGEVSSLGCHDLVLVLWACGTVRQLLPGNACQVLSSRTAELLGRMSTRQMCMCIWGLAKLGHRDEDLLDLIPPIVDSKMRNAVPQDISMLLCSFAAFPYRNYRLIQSIADWAVPRVADFPCHEMCNVMWAFAELSYHPGNLIVMFQERV